MKESIEKYVKSGDLIKMAGLLDSPEVQERDLRGFREAMAEYAELRLEKTRLERELENEGVFGRATGREFSALISGALAMLIIIVTTYMFMADKNFF